MKTPPSTNPDPDLEARLARELAGTTDRAPFPVPDGTDETVLARMRAATPGRGRLLRLAPVAAAAVLLVAALGWWQLRPEPAAERARTGEAAALGSPEAPDIVDAYLLARRIRRGETVPADWDLDGDGVVDGRDVEAVARAAVAVGKEPR